MCKVLWSCLGQKKCSKNVLFFGWEKVAGNSWGRYTDVRAGEPKCGVWICGQLVCMNLGLSFIQILILILTAATYIFEYLSSSRNCLCFSSLDLHNISLRQTLLSFPFYKWGNRGLPKATQLLSPRAGIWAQSRLPDAKDWGDVHCTTQPHQWVLPSFAALWCWEVSCMLGAEHSGFEHSSVEILDPRVGLSVPSAVK